MAQINEIEKIKVVNILNDKSFEIDLDSSNFDDYTGQGKVQTIKVPEVKSYVSLRERIEKPVN